MLAHRRKYEVVAGGLDFNPKQKGSRLTVAEQLKAGPQEQGSSLAKAGGVRVSLQQ